MNKLKFIPVLAVVAMLSACGAKSSGSAIKAPKFEKEGSEIEYADFANEVNNKLNSLAFVDSKFMGSKEGSSYIARGDESTVTTSNKKKSFEGHSEITKESFKLDAVNRIQILEGSYTETSRIETAGGSKTDQKHGENWNNTFQKCTYDGKDYYGFVDNLNQTFTLYGTVEDDQELADFHDYFAKGVMYSDIGLGDLYSCLNHIDSLSDEGRLEYQFYKNNNTYTISHDIGTVEGDSTTDGENPETVFSYVETYVEKVQMRFDGENFKLTVYTEGSEKQTYAMSANGHEAGDVVEYKSIYVNESFFKDAKLDLKPASFEGYQKVNY